MITADFQHKNKEGVAFGISTRFDDPGIIELIGQIWDFVWIDMQHGTVGPERLREIIRACDVVKTTSIVRLAGHNPDTLASVLDMDAGGVMVPQVETVEQASELVRAAKFPPLGNRSWGGRRIIDRRGREYHKTANKKQLLIVQIESPGALKNAEQIARLEGVNGLMLGPDDIKLRMGIDMKSGLDCPELLEAAKQVGAICKKYGKIGFAIARSEKHIRFLSQNDFSMIDVGADASFLAAGAFEAKELVDNLRRSVKDTSEQFDDTQTKTSKYIEREKS